MRQLCFLTTLTILILLLLMGVSGPPVAAQSGTPSATPPVNEADAAALAPVLSNMVVSLPFTDTFETGTGWSPSGGWRFDRDNAYEGASWFLNVTRRDHVSELTYQPLLDLSGTLSAQLVFRQNGYLPPTDFVAVDISVNGGNTWVMIDHQTGVSAEWEQHIVDLTEYRGQVVRLRFRAQTGDTGQDVHSGYWIDNLTIQFVMTLPDMVYAPLDLEPKALMGLHMIVGAQREPILELAERLHNIGWPLGTLKGTSGTEDIIAAVEAISPETVTIFRSLETSAGLRDCPNPANPPELEARNWLNDLRSYWAGVPADYFEIINECGQPASWLVPFSIEAMKSANEHGECLLLFSYGPGNPELEEFAQLTPVFEYALAHPCASGRLHGIALHAYGVDPNTLVSESGIYLGLRHRLLMAPILSELPEAIRIPIYLTEAGPGDGRQNFTCSDLGRDVIQYTRELEFDPYVRAFALWNIGPEENWVNFTECLPLLGDLLTRYYGGR